MVALPLIVGGGIGRQLGLPLGGGSGSGSGDGGSPFDDEDVDDDDTAGYDGVVKGRAGRSEIDLTRLPQFVADLLADTGGKVCFVVCVDVFVRNTHLRQLTLSSFEQLQAS